MTTKIATIALTEEALARMLPYGVTVAGASGVGVTFPISGTVAMGAGTLSVSSVNNATIASHTHTITNSSNPGVFSYILASAPDGWLTLVGLAATAVAANTIQPRSGTNLDLYISNNTGTSTVTIYNPHAGDVCNLSIDGTLATNTTGVINVAADKTLNVNNSITISCTDGVSVAFGAGGTVVYTTRTLTAGAGLTGGGTLAANRTFNVGAGTLITVGADTVGISVGTVQYQYIVTGADPFTPAWSTGFLNIATGESLILTKGLTVSGNSGEIAFSVTGSTVTIPETMTVAGRNVANTFTGINTWSAESNTFFHTSSATSGEHYPILSQIVAEPTGSSSAYYRGLIFNAQQNSTAALTQAAGGLVGIFGSTYLTNTGLVTLGIGVQARIQAYGANNTNIVEGRGFDSTVINWGGGGTMVMGIGSNFYSRNPVGAALSITGTFYGFYSEDINKAGTNYALYFNAGNVLFNAGGDANTDFTVRSDAYDALVVDASDNAIKIMNHASGKIGFFSATPIVRTDAYTVTNRTPDRTYDCDATTTAELADILGTLIYDLQQYGLLQ